MSKRWKWRGHKRNLSDDDMRTSSVPNFAAGSSGLQGLGGLQLPGLFGAAGAGGQGGGGGGGGPISSHPAGAGARGLGARGGGGGSEGGPYAFIKPSSADVGAHPLPSDRKDEWKDVQVKK